MADTDAFVTALMADNARLREELAQAKEHTNSARAEVFAVERKFISVLYRLVLKYGDLEVPERECKYDPRRMHIESDYDEGIKRIRLVEDTEIISPSDTVYREAAAAA